MATFNVENYLDAPSGTRPAKSREAQAKVRESILAIKPDVIALEEVGSTNALLELQAALKAAGLDLPYWDQVAGYDTNIHVSVLSRFPIVARRPHTNESFLLDGRRLQVSRGFAEMDIQVNPKYQIHPDRGPSQIAPALPPRGRGGMALRRGGGLAAGD